MMERMALEHRSGFACLVGRPNAGKTTLTNALVGRKIGITSTRPQTTRHAIRGIVHRPDSQLVLVDTPGLHKPRTVLGRRLNDIVRATWSQVDVVAFCVPADQKVGPGDRYIAAELAQLRTPIVAVVTKSDLARRDLVAGQLVATSNLGDFAEIIPVSAYTGEGVELLSDLLIQRLPPGPALYPDGQLTDEPELVLVAEFIREAALEGVRDELPHSLAVTVEEMKAREGRDDLVDIYALLYVERASQKGIVLGKNGARIKAVGTAARQQIEALLGIRVYLDLHVKVLPGWQNDPKHLGRLGF